MFVTLTYIQCLTHFFEQGILRIKYSYVGGHKLRDVPNLMVKGELSFGDSTQDVCIDKGLRDDVADSFLQTYTHPNYLPLKLYLPDVSRTHTLSTQNYRLCS